MTPGRKPTRSREEFVGAAITFADEHGISDLTLRSLGRSMGAATTAVYRYFESKDDLIIAMREALLVQAMPKSDSGDPRARLMAIALAFRATVKAHPCLSQIMGLPAVDGEVTNSVIVTTTAALEELGLEGALLVRGYRQLETFIVGACAFDFSDAPRHLDERLQRVHRAGHPAFLSALTDSAAVEADNELAFVTSLGWLIDGLITEAR